MKITFDNKSKQAILKAKEENKIFLEGNILRIIDAENDKYFEDYLDEAIENDKNNRKKRLEVTKQIQLQNKELVEQRDRNQKLMDDLKVALEKAENSKKAAEEDLDILQRKTQTELIGTIVKVALWIILGVGITTSTLFALAFFSDKDTTLLGNVWSSMFGILLTNAFSIIGTIMGVKYASESANRGS